MDAPRLMVADITPTWDKAYDPPEFFGNVISYRDATIPEVIAWLREQGAVDYRAAVKVINGDGDDGMWGLSEVDSSLIRAAVDAALSPTSQEGEV